MLETLRHYARERLDERDDVDRWRRRHAEHFAAWTETAGHAIRGPDEFVWRRRLRAELDNLRSAVTWALDSSDVEDGELALRIIAGPRSSRATTLRSASASGPPGRSTGRRRPGKAPGGRVGTRSAVRGLTLARMGPPGAPAAPTRNAAVSGDTERGRALVLESMRDDVPVDAPYPSFATSTLCYIDFNTGRFESALETFEVALERFRDRIEPIDAMTLYAMASSAQSWAGNVAQARSYAEQSLEFGRRAESPSALASGLFSYGVALRHSDPSAARDALEQCISLVETGATPVLNGYARAAVAVLRAQAGDVRGALCALRDAMRYAADHGNESLAVQVRGEAGPVLLQLGEPELAALFLMSIPDFNVYFDLPPDADPQVGHRHVERHPWPHAKRSRRGNARARSHTSRSAFAARGHRSRAGRARPAPRGAR